MRILVAEKRTKRSARSACGMTLAEVAIAMAITGLAIAGIVTGYIYCTASAQKASLHLAANARAMERIEEIRSAKWDTASWPPVDQVVVTNFPSKVVTLDLSGAGANAINATLNTEISLISTNPPLKRIRVDCVWQLRGKSVTTSIETCRAPDQ